MYQMGSKCDVCGASEPLMFKCKYCGGTFCSKHRLPENHSCKGLQEHSWNVYRIPMVEKVRDSKTTSESTRVHNTEAELPPRKKSLLTKDDWLGLLSVVIGPVIFYFPPELVFLDLILAFGQAILLHELGHLIIAKSRGYGARIEFAGDLKVFGPILSFSILKTRYWSIGSTPKKSDELDIRIAGPLSNLIFGFICLLTYLLNSNSGFWVPMLANFYLFLCNLEEL